jgi:hypothetical protein
VKLILVFVGNVLLLPLLFGYVMVISTQLSWTKVLLSFQHLFASILIASHSILSSLSNTNSSALFTSTSTSVPTLSLVLLEFCPIPRADVCLLNEENLFTFQQEPIAASPAPAPTPAPATLPFSLSSLILLDSLFELACYWFVGFLFVQLFWKLVIAIRAVCRPGLLFFIRDPHDVNQTFIRELVFRPFSKHLYATVFTIFIYGLLITVMWLMPLCLLNALFPPLTPHYVTSLSSFKTFVLVIVFYDILQAFSRRQSLHFLEVRFQFILFLFDSIHFTLFSLSF